MKTADAQNAQLTGRVEFYAAKRHETFVSLNPLEPVLVYQCAQCRGWFKQGLARCGVIHTTNVCCHHGETPAMVVLSS